MNPIDLAQTATFAALEKKAMNPMILDVRGISDLVDVHVIVSGENDKQTRAIADAVKEVCHSQFALKPLAIEGEKAGQWILLDYGMMMVHVFYREIRQYYALEALWPKAKMVEVDVSKRPARLAASQPVAAVSKIAGKAVVAKAAPKLAPKAEPKTTPKTAPKAAAKAAPKKS
jgi:ribosome-associated protein